MLQNSINALNSLHTCADDDAGAIYDAIESVGVVAVVAGVIYDRQKELDKVTDDTYRLENRLNKADKYDSVELIKADIEVLRVQADRVADHINQLTDEIKSGYCIDLAPLHKHISRY